MAFLDLPSVDLYRSAIRSGVTITYSVDASRGGSPVVGATDMAPTGGSITDTTKTGVRRALNLELAPTPGLYELLAPVGTVLTVTAEVEYTDKTSASIPMGVFDVDSTKISEGGGGLSLTAPDKWARVIRAKFIKPQTSDPGISVSQQIAALLRGALGAGEPVNDFVQSKVPAGTLTWEKDRDKAITDLAQSIGAWVYFDRNGVATIANIPTAGPTADWLVDASVSGVLTELTRETSRASTANVVVISSTSSDSPFTTQIVWDRDPVSPTYAGPDPVASPHLAGPFGVVPYYYETALALSNDDAMLTALTILARTTGLASQVTLGQVPNPAVDAFDVLDVLPPKQRYDIPRIVERHVADTVSHPLTLGSAQSIDGRSTRTDEYA